MAQRVKINDNWLLRPLISGAELISPGENIALNCSSEESAQKLLAILSGSKQVKLKNEDSDLAAIIENLQSKGIIELSSEEVCKSMTKTERVIWRLRSEVIGEEGIVNAIYWLDPEESDFTPSFYLFSAKHTRKSGNFKGQKQAWADGVHDDKNIAELKGLMEALERYSSGIVNEEELIKATKNELREKAIDPRKFVAYSEKQIREPVFPLNPFSENNTYYWKEIEDFESGQTKYLPVECIYYPVDIDLVPNLYTFGNSSGVASGLSFEAATRRGVYEAIERDAFMITWLNRIAPPHFDLSALPRKLQERIEGINSQGYEVFLVDLTLDLAPVVLAAAVSHNQKSALMLGMSSDLNIEKAMHSALAEVERQLYWEKRPDTEVECLESEKEIEGVFDHMAFYAPPERLSHASFLWSGDEISLTDKESVIYNGGGELESLVSILKNESIDLLTVDMTCPALDDLGIKVVRAIPLGLVPISFGYGMEPLGMERLEKVPNKLGLQVGSKQKRQITHPFA